MISVRNFSSKKTQLLVKLSEINKSTENKNIRDLVIRKFAHLRVK